MPEVGLSSNFPSRMPWRKTWTRVNMKESVYDEEKREEKTKESRRVNFLMGLVVGRKGQSAVARIGYRIITDRYMRYETTPADEQQQVYRLTGYQRQPARQMIISGI